MKGLTMKHAFRGSLVALALTWCASATAQQSTAQQVLPGFLTTLNCPGAATSCYITGLPVLSTSVVASSLVLKASAGNLYSLQASATAAGFIMVFNATTAPADGTVSPAICYPVAANGAVTLSFPPAYFSTGITAVYSSTGCFTKTASATAFISGSVL